MNSPLVTKIEPKYVPFNREVEISIHGINFPVSVENSLLRVMFYPFDQLQDDVTHVVQGNLVEKNIVRCAIPKLKEGEEKAYRMALSFNGRDFDFFPGSTMSDLALTMYRSPVLKELRKAFGCYTSQLRFIGVGFIDTGNASVRFQSLEDQSVSVVVPATVLSSTILECCAPPLEANTQVRLGIALNGVTFDVEWPEPVRVRNASVITSISVWLYTFSQSGFGANARYTLFGVMPVASMVVASSIALVLVSLATRPPEEEHLKRFFAK